MTNLTNHKPKPTNLVN
uniref:Uncharacterized protein n=1 Tax=Arundo donax TaxID=35708 RepID=A0A0A9GNU7_ARUDO